MEVFGTTMAFKNPSFPSIIDEAPVKPFPASMDDITPDCAALPVWMCFPILPV